MGRLSNVVKNWPTYISGEPILKDLDDATYLGALTANDAPYIKHFRVCKVEAYRQISLEKLREAPNMGRIRALAYRAYLLGVVINEAEKQSGGD